jgi:hypothetical protein
VIRFFSGNNPLNVLILFFLGILIKLPSFLVPVVPSGSDTDGFLYIALLNLLSHPAIYFPLLYPILSYLLLFTQAVTFNGLVNQQKLFQQPNYLVAFAYILLTSLVPDWNVLSPGLIINTIMVYAWPGMVGLYNHPKPGGPLFNIGFGFAICSFFYFPAILFWILLIAALLIFRPVILTEWLIALLGALTPFYFVLIYLYVWDHWSLLHTMFPGFQFRLPVFHMDWKIWVPFLLVNLPLIAGLYLSFQYSGRLLVHVRKSWRFMLFYLLTAFFMPFLNNNGGFSQFIIALVPVSLFYASFFYFPRKKGVPGLVVWLSVLWIFINYCVFHR